MKLKKAAYTSFILCLRTPSYAKAKIAPWEGRAPSSLAMGRCVSLPSAQAWLPPGAVADLLLGASIALVGEGGDLGNGRAWAWPLPEVRAWPLAGVWGGEGRKDAWGRDGEQKTHGWRKKNRRIIVILLFWQPHVWSCFAKRVLKNSSVSPKAKTRASQLQQWSFSKWIL